MQKIEVTQPTLQAVSVGASTNVLVAVTVGAGVLCIGPASPVSDCLPVEAGYQIVVPSGVDVRAAQSGGSMTIVTAPFGG